MTPTCHPHDSGALASVNVMGNKLGKEELAKLQEVMKAHSSLQSLCGIAADATEANLSGLGMDAADAAVLADDIQDKGALAFLTMHKYKLPVKEIKTAKELDLSNKELIAIDAIVIAALIEVRTVNNSCCIH